MRKYFAFVSVFALLFFAVTLLKSDHVFAASGYCDVAAFPAGTNGSESGPRPQLGNHNCDTNGSSSNAFTNVNPSSSQVDMKNQFINRMYYISYNGFDFQRGGVAYIASEMSQHRGDWQNSIKDPDIKIEVVPSYTFQYNTAYEIYPTVGITTYLDGGTRQAIVFSSYRTREIYYVIKQDCGNPLDGFRGLPSPSPTWSVSGNTLVNGNPWIGTSQTNFNSKGTTSATNGGSPYYTYGIHGGWFSNSNPSTTDPNFKDIIGESTGTSGPDGTATFVAGSANHYGGYYCEYVSFSPQSSSNSSVGYGNVICKQLMAPPDKPPIGSINAACQRDGAGIITMTFSDPDGPTSANVSFFNNGKYSVVPARGTLHTGNSPPAGFATYASNTFTWIIKASDADGPWHVQFVVQDNGGNLDRTYTASITSATGCNSLPVGGYIQSTCDQLSAWTYDPNDTRAAINYNVYVNGTKAYSAQTNKLDQTANNLYDRNDKTTLHAFTVDPTTIPGFNPRASNVIQVKGIDPMNGQEGSFGTVNIGPCIHFSCTSTFPPLMIVGKSQSFAVAVNTGVNFGPPWVAPTDPALTVSVTGPAGYVSQTFVPGYTASTSSHILQSNIITGFTPSAAGTYRLNWKLTGGASTNCGYGQPIGTPNTGTAGYGPYFSVIGGDTAAGPGYCGLSTTDNSAGVTGINTNVATYAGAGTNLAVLAMGQVFGFASGQNSGSTTTPSALSFANASIAPPNKNDVANGYYGGGLANTNWCVPDYVSSAGTGSPTGSSVSVSNLPNGVTTSTGDLTLSGGIIAADGRKVKLIVKGDVYITPGTASGITYGGYTTLQTLPEFQLLVTGNIYIDREVTSLHGVFIAEPAAGSLPSTTTSGYIHTCSTGLRLPTTMYDLCGAQLTFYGAVSAAHQALERTDGNIIAVGTIPSEPAEKFVFTPELWLANSTAPVGTAMPPNWQTVTSLPPVL